jgi:hypothetical protein
MMNVDRAMLLMFVASGVCMMQSAGCTIYPSNVPLGVVSDCVFAFVYIWTGQTVFWSRQASVHTRYMLSGADAEASTSRTRWSVRNMVDFAERRLTPLAYCVMVVLVASGVCTRSQLVLVIFWSVLVWGVALTHAHLFTQLATIANVIKIHNKAGGENAVVQRRQTAVSRMVLNLVLQLVVVFCASVSHSFAVLAYNAQASSARLLVVNSISTTLNCMAFTPFTYLRIKRRNRLKRKLQSATTEARNNVAASSAFTSSVLDIQSTLPVH